MNRIKHHRRLLTSIVARLALSLAVMFAGAAHADWAVNDKDANKKLEEIQDRIGKGDLNETSSKLLNEIKTSVANLGFSATLTPNNQLQKISDTSSYVKQACPSKSSGALGALGALGSALGAIGGGDGGAGQNVTSLATIDAGKQQICQQLIQLRVQAFNDSIEMANRFQQYSEQLTKIDSNRGSAKTQGDLWANTNESLRTIGKLQAEMGFWRTRLAAYESAIKFHEGQQNALSQTAIKGGGGVLPGLGQLIQTGALAAALAIK
jgi:Mg2+ and Co2+ transporter CorA